jgi:hypothetical protein
MGVVWVRTAAELVCRLGARRGYDEFRNQVFPTGPGTVVKALLARIDPVHTTLPGRERAVADRHRQRHRDGGVDRAR